MSRSMPSSPTLSVAVIVRDAADALAETLASVAGAADELLVLDTGSTDGSPERARSAGAKVWETTWNNDFSAARNELWQHAAGDWVLWLDAGETLSPSDAADLREFVATAADPSRAYMMLVIIPAGQQTQPAEQVGRVRLVPRVPGIAYEGRVRESIEGSLAEIGIELDGLPMRILRGPREHDPELILRRARRDLVLAEQEIKEAGAAPRLLLALGEALRNLAQPQLAREVFSNAVHRSGAGSSEMLEAYYGLIATLGDEAPAGVQRQLATCLEALEIFPLDAQLLCAAGGFLVQQGEVELGIRSFETAFDHGQVNPHVQHLIDLTAMAAVCAATALASRNEEGKAAAILDRALAADPGHDLLRARREQLRSRMVPPSAIAGGAVVPTWQAAPAAGSPSHS